MRKDLRTVFLGSPDFAVPVLDAVARFTDLRAVVTQPDKPAGRGRCLSPPPVKVRAQELGVPVWQPEVVKGKRFAARVAELVPDVVITAAFGKLLGRSLLAVPRLGCVNVHASLLPAYRGAAPVAWAIANGEETTGVSIMAMVEEMDAGPIFHQVAVPIDEGDTTGTLTAKLAQVGAEALCAVLTDIERRTPVPQDPARVTYARMLCKADGRVRWGDDAQAVARWVRAMTPWPGAFALWEDKQIKIRRAEAEDRPADGAAPGTVVDVSDDILVACGSGCLRLQEVQAPGRKPLPAAAFVAGARLQVGQRLA